MAEDVHRVMLEGYCRGDVVSTNHVRGAYLRRLGFMQHILPDDCPDCYAS